MAPRDGPEQANIVLQFGGGLRTRTPENQIADQEAADGYNFLIDVASAELKPRPAFDLVTTAANGSQINGGGSFRASDGTVYAFFQAGTSVYKWTGGASLTTVIDTVNSNARLRAHWASQSSPFFEGGDAVLVSDLALVEPVMIWDGGGTTADWNDVAFRDGESSLHGVAFRSKYIGIFNERAYYANIKDGGTVFGHMIIGAHREEADFISVEDRPSSALSDADPFFLLTPDLQSVNGFIGAFGMLVLSTDRGRMFHLLGESPKEFAFRELYPGSFAAGDESVVFTGNKIVYGRQGRIETLLNTDIFSNTEKDDLSLPISDQVQDYGEWTIVFNSRLGRIYAFPEGEGEVWVFDTAFEGSELSPWMKWTTAHALDYQPTFVMPMLDPTDGLEYVFMGDSAGRVYRMEGTGTSGDGGSASRETRFTSKLIVLPNMTRLHKAEGYIKYRRGAAATVSIALLYAGEAAFTESVSLSLPTHSTFLGRMARQRFEIAGGDTNEFQIQVTVTSSSPFAVNEIGLTFSANS